MPARGAGIWFIVFIASMMSSVSPALTTRADLDERLGAGLGRAIGGADHRRGDDARDARPASAARGDGALTTAATGRAARGGRDRDAAPPAGWRATRTRRPPCSTSISVRLVSSSRRASERTSSSSTWRAALACRTARHGQLRSCASTKGRQGRRSRAHSPASRSRRSPPWRPSRRRSGGGMARARGCW